MDLQIVVLIVTVLIGALQALMFYRMKQKDDKDISQDEEIKGTNSSVAKVWTEMALIGGKVRENAMKVDMFIKAEEKENNNLKDTLALLLKPIHEDLVKIKEKLKL